MLFFHRTFEWAVIARAIRMHNSDYYREQAAHYRELAEGVKEPAAKQEFWNWQQLVKRPPTGWTIVELVVKRKGVGPIILH